MFEYDLKSRRSRRAFPQAGEALIFDWTPDGAHLVCVLGSGKDRREADGIWVGRPGEDDWWQVPHSDELAPGQLPSVLEQLRATRPAWTEDGGRFAFVSYQPGPAPARRLAAAPADPRRLIAGEDIAGEVERLRANLRAAFAFTLR